MILQNFNKMLITEIFQSMRRQPKKDILAGHRSKENSRDHKAPLLKQEQLVVEPKFPHLLKVDNSNFDKAVPN